VIIQFLKLNKEYFKMDRKEILEKVQKVVKDVLSLSDDKELKEETSFVEDLEADSLDAVEVIMALEEEFGTEIPDEDAEKIKTVKDAVEYVEKHQ
jgi:acyl carrier protein